MTYGWRSPFKDPELNELHARAFKAPVPNHPWWNTVNQHSLGWVCAHEGKHPRGFVNVAWDGSTHAFLLDTVVAPANQRRDIGRQLVATASEHTKASGCQWLHVDFEPHLHEFYLIACGFTATSAGLIRLASP